MNSRGSRRLRTSIAGVETAYLLRPSFTYVHADSNSPLERSHCCGHFSRWMRFLQGGWCASLSPHEGKPCAGPYVSPSTEIEERHGDDPIRRTGVAQSGGAAHKHRAAAALAGRGACSFCCKTKRKEETSRPLPEVIAAHVSSSVASTRECALLSSAPCLSPDVARFATAGAQR